MARRVRIHDVGLWGGTATLVITTAYDLAALLTRLLPNLPAPIHADVLAAAVGSLAIGGFCRFAVRPLREALIHGYRLRAEHEAEQRAAGVEVKARVPGRAYSTEIVPPAGAANPRHRADGRPSRGPAPQRSR